MLYNQMGRNLMWKIQDGDLHAGSLTSSFIEMAVYEHGGVAVEINCVSILYFSWDIAGVFFTPHH